MTPDRYTVTLDRINEAVETLRALGVPPARVSYIAVQHWSAGPVVDIHIEGATEESVTLVDRIADHYSLPPDTEATSNYSRGGYLGTTPVLVFCGRPKDRATLIREWVAQNYSDESKRLVEEGAEATPEDQAKFTAAEAAGLFVGDRV